jgi:hypothetical protein
MRFTWTNSRQLFAVGLLTVTASLAAACSVSAPYNNGGDGISDGAGEATVPVGDDTVRLNQLQFIGSHNSYHVAPEAPILQWLDFFSTQAPAVASALGSAALLNYTHAPLATQLQRGVRSFELDIAADPAGGKFARPLLPDILTLSVKRPTGMSQPGMKVIHIQDIDFISTCPTLIGCMDQLKTWSDAHPGHLPVIINLELKDENLPAPVDATKMIPFDATQLNAVDAEIRSVLGDRLLTPDDVRGTAADLRTAITTTGWPTVADSRGKFLFFIDNADKRDVYLAGHPSLAGRAMFTSSGEGQPDGAVLKENNPADGSRIRQLVQQGYLVRTRADDNVTAPNPTQRDIALASGAQIIHSDFIPGESDRSTGYVVSFGTRVSARCNPVNTTAQTCGPAAAVEANP